jgi:hypothetical protein
MTSRRPALAQDDTAGSGGRSYVAREKSRVRIF